MEYKFKLANRKQLKRWAIIYDVKIRWFYSNKKIRKLLRELF